MTSPSISKHRVSKNSKSNVLVLGSFCGRFGVHLGVLLVSFRVPFGGPWGGQREEIVNVARPGPKKNIKKPWCFEGRRRKTAKNTLVFVDFTSGAIEQHFGNTQTAAYVCRFRPYPKSTGATKKAPGSTNGSHWKSEVQKSRICVLPKRN